MLQKGNGSGLPFWRECLTILYGEMRVIFWHARADFEDAQDIRGIGHGCSEGERDRWIVISLSESIKGVLHCLLRFLLPFKSVDLPMKHHHEQLCQLLVMPLLCSLHFLQVNLEAVDTSSDTTHADVNQLDPLMLAVFQLLVELFHPCLDGCLDLVLERPAIVLLLEQCAERTTPGAIIEPCEDVLHGI